MAQARGMCVRAQLPCFVMAVRCAVSPGNIKPPVLCVRIRDLPWISGPRMLSPAGRSPLLTVRASTGSRQRKLCDAPLHLEHLKGPRAMVPMLAPLVAAGGIAAMLQETSVID